MSKDLKKVREPTRRISEEEHSRQREQAVQIPKSRSTLAMFRHLWKLQCTGSRVRAGRA